MRKNGVLLAVSAMAFAVSTSFFIEPVSSQSRDRVRDPGVRVDPPGALPSAGGHIAGLTDNEIRFFDLGKEDFEEVEGVADGLGPRMNLDACGACHSQPATGGTSPALNPQVAFAKSAWPSQFPAVDSFIRENGPVREARFVRNPDGTPDGGVHALFTITGRKGADDPPPGPCRLEQPDFDREIANRNVIFRIPTPVFGAGLIEQIPDTAILANQASSAWRKRDLGINGRANYRVSGRTISGQANNNGNDGTISRFGWKAQNQTLLLFSGEAYNVEMGITSELFQVERDETPSCQFATVPNDTQNFEAADALSGTTAIQNFANFQRFLAPPVPSADKPGGADSIARGRGVFDSTGCALCHTPTLRTGNSTVAALRNQPANLFSDLLVHDMGDGLADGISQGQAGPREFRTAPLWGLGQRIFFLHDGRTSDLIQAIRHHRSEGSEANRVVGNFDDLRDSQKQDLLNFLRSL
jgi:CxxC motif-containing protein (DUF1111 family)